MRQPGRREMSRPNSALIATALVFALMFSAFGGILPAKAGELVDVGFEDGTLDGWLVVSSPDAVGVSAADAYTQPYWGDYMAVLGTPQASNVPQPLGPNSIAKTFTVLTPSIAFAYNMFTKDYPPFDLLSYVVTLTVQGTVVAQFSMIAFGVPPGGPIISTGWREVNLDLSLYRGQEVTIQIGAGGTLDTSLSSWAYFDMRPVTPSIGDMMGPVIRLPGLDTLAGMSIEGSSGSRQYTLVTDVYDDSGWATVGILQNGVTVTGGSGVGWQTYHLALSEGPNDLVLVASDAFGNTTSRSAKVYVDSTPPDVVLNDVPRHTSSASAIISGIVFDTGSGISIVTVDGVEIPVAADGSFATVVRLALGKNTSTVTATDGRGNSGSWTVESDRIVTAGGRHVAMNGWLRVGETLGMLEGVSFPMDAAPVIKNGRTLLPIRALIETLGGKVTWNAKTRTAAVSLGAHSVVLVVGKNAALVDGKSVPIDPADPKVVPEIIGSRTFLPLRFIAESLGLELTWDAATQTVSFAYWPQ
jgi:hypothetical protein